jgi:F-type H+-transporting ATPase subunit a
MKLNPSGFQNFLEFLYEGLYQLTENVAGPKHAAKFFALPATIFIYVILSNWLALFPGLPLMGVGLCEEHHVEAKAGATTHEAEVAVAKWWKTCKPGEVIVPFLRSTSADLNNTLSLALVTQVLAQIFGITILGIGGYAGKFFVTQKMTSAKSGGEFALGIIDFLVGLLELLSEFIKVLAYTFRLYGNIFAGEVTVFIVVFFIPLFAVLPMLAFEVFVGFIQAFVFFILSVAFYTLASTGHGGHDEAH